MFLNLLKEREVEACIGVGVQEHVQNRYCNVDKVSGFPSVMRGPRIAQTV
jgi:hypothetical protein